MEGRDVKALMFLFAVVLTVLCACLGLGSLSSACDGRGGHFEGYWGGKGMVCVGGDKR